MNQVKIGKFIAECRKKQGLTQEQLADMLNITNKAISKWENGRCLMDISLLSPLSKILNVSIIEIINGEYINKDNVYKKSDEALKESLEYANKKINNTKFKTSIIVVVLIILVTVITFILYKMIIIKKYYVPKTDNYTSIINGLNNQNEIVIYKKTLLDNEYIKVDNIKLRNDFEDYNSEIVDGINPMVKYSKYDGNNVESMLWVTSSDTYKKYFESDAVFFINKDGADLLSKFNNADRGYLLLKNDINNDIDLFNYIKNNYYLDNSIFMSSRQIKENASINAFANVFNTSFSGITIIKGDYMGYIFNYDNGIKEVNIIKDDKRYIFTFFGKIANDSYIMDLLSTLELIIN